MLPAEAVIGSGERQYVILTRSDGRLEPRRVWTRMREGDRVEILRGLVAGDTVAASAAFLIDSESRLEAAIAGLSGRRALPEYEERR